jgi:hypothetical protein
MQRYYDYREPEDEDENAVESRDRAGEAYERVGDVPHVLSGTPDP